MKVVPACLISGSQMSSRVQGCLGSPCFLRAPGDQLPMAETPCGTCTHRTLWIEDLYRKGGIAKIACQRVDQGLQVQKPTTGHVCENQAQCVNFPTHYNPETVMFTRNLCF